MRFRRYSTAFVSALAVTAGAVLSSSAGQAAQVNAQSGAQHVLNTTTLRFSTAPVVATDVFPQQHIAPSLSVSFVKEPVDISSDVLESRSDNGDESGGGLFKSIKKPIKSIFKSWFEPSADALQPDSSSSTYFFAPPSQKNPLKTIVSKVTKQSPSTSAAAFTSGTRSAGVVVPASRYRPNLHRHPSAYRQSHARRAASPTYSLGDPENGRGMTFSIDNGQDQPTSNSDTQQQASESNYQQQPDQSQATSGGGEAAGGGGGGGLSFSLGGGGGGISAGGGRGLALNFGGGGGGGGGGGRGLSFSMGGGGAGGGGGGGRGLSLSLGGGNGIQLGFGGNGGGEQQPTDNSASSSNTYQYSQGASGSGGGSYSGDSSYGGQSYGNGYSNNNYGYSNKPRFSVTMPSKGKTVIETNYRPPNLKLKVNASPKVKITTGTRDPLEKPPEEEIEDDIFGEPQPFLKPNKTSTASANGTDGMNGFNHTAFGGQFPYPYPMPIHPSQYYAYYQQYYPHYFQHYQHQFQGMNNSEQMAMPMPMPVPPTFDQNSVAQPEEPTQEYSSGGSGYGKSQSYGGSYDDYSKYPQPYKHDPIAIASQKHFLKTMAPMGGNMPQQQQNQPHYGQQHHSMVAPTNNGQLAYSSSMPLPTISRSMGGSRPANPIPIRSFRRAPLRPAGQQSAYAAARSPTRAVMLRSNKRSSSLSSSAPRDMMSAKGSSSMMTYVKAPKLNNYQARRRSNTAKYQQEMAGADSKSYYHFHPSDAKLSPSSYFQPQSSQPMTPSATSQQPQYYPPPPYGQFNATGQNSAYSDYYSQLYSNPAYYNYYQQYYQYAKQYYEQYYAKQNVTNGHSADKSMHDEADKQHNSTLANGHSDRLNSTYAPYSKQLLSGFNQNNLDWHQSKKFGTRLEKYQGGTTNEDKSKIVFDVRPRVTIRSLNRTQAEAELRKQQKRKEREQIFKTKLTVLMQTTTTEKPHAVKPANYYKYNYYDDEQGVDEFGYTKAPPTPEPSSTKRPKTTTRRRTTTTEEPTSDEDDEETSGESSTEDSSSTTSTTEASTDEDSSKEDVEDEDDNKSSTTSTTTTTTTTTTESTEDVIDASDEKADDDKEKIASKDKGEEEEDEEAEVKTPAPRKSTTRRPAPKEDDDTDEDEDVEKTASKAIDSVKTAAQPVTASPELVAAMVKALQEAFATNPLNNPMPTFIATTPAPTPSSGSRTTADDEDSDSAETEAKKKNDADCPDNNKTDDAAGDEEEEDKTTTTEKENKDTATSSQEDDDVNGQDGGSSAQAEDDDEMKPARSKLIPTVFSAVVTNTTQLRLKTPVVNIKSHKNRPQAFAFRKSSGFSTPVKSVVNSNNKRSSTKTSNSRSVVNIKKGSGLGKKPLSRSRISVTTTSPLKRKQRQQPSSSSKSSKRSSMPKLIDGDAILKAGSVNNHDINVDDMSDDERKQMLTNILQIVQKSQANNELVPEIDSNSSSSGRKRTKNSKSSSTSSSASKRAGAKLFPVTKANNVRIISSLEELTAERRSSDSVDPSNQPVYVVLMPQNKKKK